MTTSREDPDATSVRCVGDVTALEAIDDLEVERVAADDVAERAAWADCVVATEPDGGLEALAEVAGTAVPTVLYDRTGDPAVAARASRLGVTEYVTDTALDGETLADRVRAVADDDRTRAAGALESLHAVATDRSLSPAAKLDRLLDVGRERLDLDLGYLTEVDAGTSTVVAASGDHEAIRPGATTPLSETFCRRTLDGDSLCCIHDVAETGDSDDPAHLASGLRCYVGGTVVVDGEAHATVCFASDAPRARPFSSRERRFVELLVERIGYELDRDRRERALRRYKAVHETVEEMVFVVGEGTRLELVTEPLLVRFGYDRDSLVGESLATILDDEAVADGYQAFQALQDGAESVTLETEIRDADDDPVPVEVDLSLLSPSTEFEGLVGVVRDRTALTETRAELEAERDRFQSLFDQLPDAVVDAEFVDGEPYVRAVNPAFEDVFGYGADTAVGESVNDLIVPESRQEAARRVDRNSTAEGYDMAEVERETADGRRTFLFRGFVYATEDGNDRGFGIYTDVTDRLEQERRLRVLHRVLRHNLRNEMTGVVGYAELLVDELSDPELYGYAQRIRSQAGDVTKLGEQVQRIERALDRDRRRSPVDAAAVAGAVADQFCERHPEATVRVDADVADVVADDLLSLALENLVENAFEHTDGEPAVEIQLEHAGDGWVDLTVRDDGPGIPERERAVVGGEREITQLDHSRGLGLWVARWIVEGVGGRLIFGDPEEGAAVTLRLQHLAESRAGSD